MGVVNRQGPSVEPVFSADLVREQSAGDDH